MTCTITRIRRTQSGTDAYGDPVWTEEGRALRDAFVAPRTSSDVEGVGRDGVVVGLTLFGPVDLDVTAHDVIDVGGDRYRILGDVARWESPFSTWRPGSSVALERAEG